MKRGRRNTTKLYLKPRVTKQDRLGLWTSVGFRISLGLLLAGIPLMREAGKEDGKNKRH